MLWNIPLDDERTLSVEQFCEVEGLTSEEFNRLSDLGAAPTLLLINLGDFLPGAVLRIAPRARTEWHERLAVRYEHGKYEYRAGLRPCVVWNAETEKKESIAAANGM